MREQVIRLNDPSDHGGHMVTASARYKADGIQACVNGDLHVCPLKDHGTTPVTASTVITSSGGKKILRVNDLAGCGARLISGSPITKSE